MNVTELMELAYDLSTGHYNNMTQKEKAMFLKYLNMANNQLYIIAANGLQTLTKKVDIFLDSVTSSFLIPDDLFCIRVIRIGDSKPLKKCDVDEEAMIPYNKYMVREKGIYCDLTSTSLPYPTKADPADGVIKKYITLFYAANPKKLVEDVQDANMETSVPVYPPVYHQSLVFGALYYFYFSNKVYAEKVPYARAEWQEAKEKLQSYKDYSL